MLFNSTVIALLSTSMLSSIMLLYSAYYGYLVIRRWNLSSGSEFQLSLERRTYLISTILTYLFVFQILSLFLYLFTADALHSLFVGAMCAAGTLNVNGYGYPTLLLKVLNLLLAGVWLIVNSVDNHAYDYPLINKKYVLLLVITPFIIAESVTLFQYFFHLNPNIITSCCGSLFSEGAQSITPDIVSLPRRFMETVLYLSIIASIVSGLGFYFKSKGGYLFSVITAGTSVISILSIISFISPYIYELPNHHCPFCILQQEYRYVGYPLYAGLFGGAVTGIGVGVLMPFRGISSLKLLIPQAQKILTRISVLCYLVFIMIVTYCLISSNLVLQ